MTAKTPEPFPTLKDLPLDSIRMDGGTQPRVRIDEEIVREYAERMEAGDHFPPVQVYFDGTDHWLSDGFHRVRAAREAEKPTIQAEVWEGTRDDAFWMSLGANKDHGLRRSNEDKVSAVQGALRLRPDLSNRQIADHVGVCEAMVRKYRAETGAHGAHLTTHIGRDGKQYPSTPVREPSGAPPDPDDIPLDLPARPETAAAASTAGPPSAAQGVTDELGHPVEGAVADAFRRRQEIQDLMTTVSKVKTTVLKAIEAKDLLFADINPSRFEAECNSVYHQLKAAMPYAACPYCRAAGCKVCLGRGWVSEGVYERAPKELKAS
jgi:hypothetical protein